MTTTTIRVSTRTRDTLHELARAAGVPMQHVIEEALEVYRRQQILLATNAAYAALRANETAWNNLVAEHAAWDDALADGLEEV
jgi:predicted transcriptional regulator